MRRITAARLTVLAYALGALFLGIAFSVWHFGDKVDSYYRHPGGSISDSRNSRQPRTDWPSGETVYVSVATGRPLTRVEKLLVGTWEALPVLFATAFVGAFWGLTHVTVRAAMGSAAGDQAQVDYCDAPGENSARSPQAAGPVGSLS